MLYRKRRIRHFNKFKFFIALFLALLCLLVFLFEKQVSENKPEFVRNHAKIISTKAICGAVNEFLEENNYTYGQLARVSCADGGKVSAIETNSMLINEIKARVTLSAQEELEKLRECEVKIPLGAFTSFTLLSNAGPEISVNFCITGSLNCEIVSTFESAGINQTVHHIRLIVSADIITTSMDYNGAVDFETDFELAQSVIVGEAPPTYGGVYGKIS